jgi:hypothetical protein
MDAKFKDLRSLFDRFTTVRTIAEELQCQSEAEDALNASEEMNNRDFDYMGVKNSKGVVYGYLRRSDLDKGTCKEYATLFGPSDLVAESMPLMDLLTILIDTDRVFVLDRNRVSGVVTRADLQKDPVRLLLFGLVTILELYMLNLIKMHYLNDSWQNILKPARLKKAEQEFQRLKRDNQELGLEECLQFCDKRVLCVANENIRKVLGIRSKSEGKSVLEDIERIRNNLAHAQDLLVGLSWSRIINAANLVDNMLKCCEKR